jgi:hypothetical protein
MNGQNDYQTRAIITGVIILCATALTIMRIMTPERWEYIALTAGVVYMGVKFAKDYLDSATKNGNGKITKADLGTFTANIIREMKNGGQANGENK